MKVFAILVNVFLPGVGTLMVGKIAQGVIQLVLIGVAGFLLMIPVLGLVTGAPLGFIVWVWALVSAATASDIRARN